MQKNKLKFWHYILFFSLAALIFSAIFAALTPETEKVIMKNPALTSNYDRTQSTFKKIVFLGQEIELPETFRVFNIVSSNKSADILANQIISEEKLLLHDSVPNYWVGESTQLAKSDFEKNYTFVKISDDKDSELPIIKSQAIQTCSNFYSKYEIDLGLTIQENSIIYISGGSEPTQTDEINAQVMQIPLTYELDGYPVFYENEEEYPFFCQINNKYDLERVVFKNFFYGFEPTGELPPISVSQAVDNIRSGIVSIISAESQIEFIVDLNWIEEANLNSVELEYRYDDQLKIVYPFYRFRGQLTNSAGINIQASLITPAVATTREQ